MDVGVWLWLVNHARSPLKRSLFCQVHFIIYLFIFALPEYDGSWKSSAERTETDWFWGLWLWSVERSVAETTERLVTDPPRARGGGVGPWTW